MQAECPQESIGELLRGRSFACTVCNAKFRTMQEMSAHRPVHKFMRGRPALRGFHSGVWRLLE